MHSTGLSTISNTALALVNLSYNVAGYPTTQKHNEWISALNKIESFNLQAVIAGQPGLGPRIIEETRQYIRDFDRLAPYSLTRSASGKR